MHSSNEFLELKGIGDIDRKLVVTEGYCIPIGLFVFKIGLDFTSSDYNDSMIFLSNEVLKEQVA